jgi:ubiquinone/menaquinone biosynthesis C-methylase UbiE
MSSQRPPDWQLPTGVTPGLWEYVHQEELAAHYLSSLATSPVIAADQTWVAKHVGTVGNVLDLGCGPGRSLIPLARRGLACVGVDLSDAMLRQAASEGDKAGVRIDWIKANVVELGCFKEAAFDHVVCLFSTLGMIHPTTARRKALAEARRVLKPGGKFLLHVHNRWFQQRQQGWGKLLKEWLLSCWPGREVKDEPMPVHQGVANLIIHAFTWKEVMTLLEREGFRIVETMLLGLSQHGQLRWPWWWSSLRAHGYLIAAVKE